MHTEIKTLWVSWILATTLWMVPHPVPAETFESLQDAQTAVNHAWEIYHHAALSGTLASPQLQTQIEKDLHQARQLLVDLWDKTKTVPLNDLRTELHQIEQLTQEIIRSSRRPKP